MNISCSDKDFLRTDVCASKLRFRWLHTLQLTIVRRTTCNNIGGNRTGPFRIKRNRNVPAFCIRRNIVFDHHACGAVILIRMHVSDGKDNGISSANKTAPELGL